MVTTAPVAEPVAEQPLKPPVKPIVGVGETTKAGLNVTVTVPWLASAPKALLLRPTVQVAFVAPATCEEPLKVTVLTEDGLITIAEAGEESEVFVRVSLVVLTLKVVAAYEPGPGFVTPPIVRVAAVAFPSAHV